jgi:hypothetical protein
MYGHRVVSVRRTQRPPTPTVHAAQLVFCLLCSWAIIIHLLFILLLDFKIWESFAAIVLINLTWWAYVVSQSVVLYSRLNLVLHIKRIGDYVLYMIIFTAIVFGFTTVVFSSVAVSTYTSLSHLRSRFNC